MFGLSIPQLKFSSWLDFYGGVGFCQAEETVSSNMEIGKSRIGISAPLFFFPPLQLTGKKFSQGIKGKGTACVRFCAAPGLALIAHPEH